MVSPQHIYAIAPWQKRRIRVDWRIPTAKTVCGLYVLSQSLVRWGDHYIFAIYGVSLKGDVN